MSAMNLTTIENLISSSEIHAICAERTLQNTLYFIQSSTAWDESADLRERSGLNSQFSTKLFLPYHDGPGFVMASWCFDVCIFSTSPPLP